MSTIRIVASIIFIVVCLVCVFFIFQSKGDGADLSGGIAGRSAETYFSTYGKKHSEDAIRERSTVIAIVVFIVLALVLNMGWGLS